MAVKAVADGAAVDVDVGTGGEIGGVGLHVGADHFALDPAVERHVDKLALMGEGRVINGDGDLAVHEVHEDGERNQNDPNDESKNEAHTCLFPASSGVHRRAWKGSWRQKAAGSVQKKSVPVKFGLGLVCDNGTRIALELVSVPPHG